MVHVVNKRNAQLGQPNSGKWEEKKEAARFPTLASVCLRGDTERQAETKRHTTEKQNERAADVKKKKWSKRLDLQ